MLYAIIARDIPLPRNAAWPAARPTWPVSNS